MLLSSAVGEVGGESAEATVDGGEGGKYAVEARLVMGTAPAGVRATRGRFGLGVASCRGLLCVCISYPPDRAGPAEAAPPDRGLLNDVGEEGFDDDVDDDVVVVDDCDVSPLTGSRRPGV